MRPATRLFLNMITAAIEISGPSTAMHTEASSDGLLFYSYRCLASQKLYAGDNE